MTMTLFEIDEAQDRLLADLFDPETGEINEDIQKALDDLEIDWNEKVDGWCFWLKQQRAEYKADKEMLDAANERLRRKGEVIEKSADLFQQLLRGEKFKSTFNSVYYRTTESVALDDGVDIRDVSEEYIRYRDPELQKDKIKAALKLGINVPGVHLESKTSMVIR